MILCLLLSILACNGFSQLQPDEFSHQSTTSVYESPTPTSIPTITPTLSPTKTPIPPASASEGPIAFTSDRDSIFKLYIINSDGTNLTKLSDSYGSCPAWSPDGSRLAFCAVPPGETETEIFVIDMSSREQMRLTNNPSADLDPIWSPDGSRIAFTSTRDSNFEIYLINSDGTNLVNLTNHPSVDREPIWSPDGSQIAFTSDRGGGGNVYTLNADGTNLTQLTDYSGSGLLNSKGRRHN